MGKAPREKKLPEAINADGVPATYANVKYGPHERNLLDIWLADSDKPTPLVIFIHGGAFASGDKSMVYKSKVLTGFLKAGVSFATINYRYCNTDPQGVMGSLHDSTRALQFMRSKAKEWNIDKKRIGAYGSSAGAGTSLWIGFNDDMADPKNPDPVLRESTRLTVIGALNTQSTYDLMQYPDMFDAEVEQNPADQEISEFMLDFYGVENPEDLYTPEGEALRAELDMLALMSKDDPPIYVSNTMEGGMPTDRNHLLHHPMHAVVLKERAEEVGLEALVYAPAMDVMPPRDERESMTKFFLRHLGMKEKKKDK
jgi:acetyl esterase/lipase